MVEETQTRSVEQQYDFEEMDELDRKILSLAEASSIPNSNLKEEVAQLASQVIDTNKLESDKAGLLAYLMTTSFTGLLPEEVRKALAEITEKARFLHPEGLTDMVLQRIDSLIRHIEPIRIGVHSGSDQIQVSSIKDSLLGQKILEFEARRLARESNEIFAKKGTKLNMKPFKNSTVTGVLVTKVFPI